MGTYLDYYIINLSVDDKNVELDPDSYSFSITDSIYSLYNSCVFSFEDSTGFLQEGLGVARGNKYKLEYGVDDEINSCEYVIDTEALDEINLPGYLTGKVTLKLKNAWWYEQEIKNHGYTGRISNIIRDLASGYNFKEIDIDDTGNEDQWLQTLMTDAKFITDMLLPNAFSRNANSSPFFAFITSDNVFHLRNWDSMMSEGRIAKLEYKTNPGSNSQESSIAQFNKTVSIKRWSSESKENWNLYKRNIYKIDREDGELVKEEDAITDYPDSNNLKIPVIKDDNDPYTGYLNLQFTETSTGRKENLVGQTYTSMKSGMFFDRFLGIFPFNPVLHSGRTVQLDVFTLESNGTKLSKRFAGYYLIENCEHVWNGTTRTGFTKVLLGRKYLSLPSSYLLGPKLY